MSDLNKNFNFLDRLFLAPLPTDRPMVSTRFFNFPAFFIINYYTFISNIIEFVHPVLLFDFCLFFAQIGIINSDFCESFCYYLDSLCSFKYILRLSLIKKA